MTELLIKLFVKDKDNTGSKKVRKSYGVLAGIVGIAANTLLCAAKFLIGVLTGSVAIQADAVNNLADIGSNVVTLVGADLAGRPADREHPYGHARMEYVAALVMSFLILMVGIGLGKESVAKIFNPVKVDYSIVSMMVLMLSILVKLWMGLFTANIGRRIDSAAMSAATADSLCDCISTGAILVSSVIGYFWNINLDGYIGVLVTGFVLYSGIRLIKETISPLMGEAPDAELVGKLESRIKNYDGIVDVHDILIHSYGPGTTIASAHAEVPASGDILEIHELIDRIESEVGGELGMLLTIHMDPVELDNEQVNRAKAIVSDAIASLGERVSFHDFRMVPGEKRSNLVFDLVLPFGTQKEKTVEIVKTLKARVKEADPSCFCVIKVENDYSGIL